MGIQRDRFESWMQKEMKEKGKIDFNFTVCSELIPRNVEDIYSSINMSIASKNPEKFLNDIEVDNENTNAKYKSGYKFICHDGIVGVVEFVYSFGKMDIDKQHYGYSCCEGDGIVEESKMNPYKGEMKNSEISPLHPDNVTGEGICGTLSAFNNN